MQNAFQILGVNSDVSLKELKRAYFSLVRVHTPEKEPEQFKVIRSAYEDALVAVETDTPLFTRSDNPKEYAMEQDVIEAKDAPRAALAFARDGLKRYPKNAFFLYNVCFYTRAAEDPTNVIGVAEKLLKQDPENHHYQANLALAYIGQNWTKKALSLCDKIMQKGSRNAEFLNGYITLLYQYGKYDDAYLILYHLISENECQQALYLKEMTKSCINLIDTCAFLKDDARTDSAADLLIQYIQKNGSLLGEAPYISICSSIYSCLKKAKSDQIPTYLRAILRIQKAAPDAESAKINTLLSSLKIDKMKADSRLPKCVPILYEAYLLDQPYHPNAVKMDARLCGINERDALLAAKDILKKDYPELYAKITPFLRAISTAEKAAELKEELLEKYEEYDADYFPNRKRHFYDLYPDEKPEWMDDDEEDDFFNFFSFFHDDEDDDEEYDEDDYDDEDDDDFEDAEEFIEFMRKFAKQKGYRFPF